MNNQHTSHLERLILFHRKWVDHELGPIGEPVQVLVLPSPEMHRPCMGLVLEYLADYAEYS
jgi:hypothetical protein